MIRVMALIVQDLHQGRNGCLAALKKIISWSWTLFKVLFVVFFTFLAHYGQALINLPLIGVTEAVSCIFAQ
jgi:hypothetical protein